MGKVDKKKPVTDPSILAELNAGEKDVQTMPTRKPVVDPELLAELDSDETFPQKKSPVASDPSLEPSSQGLPGGVTTSTLNALPQFIEGVKKENDIPADQRPVKINQPTAYSEGANDPLQTPGEMKALKSPNYIPAPIASTKDAVTTLANDYIASSGLPTGMPPDAMNQNIAAITDPHGDPAPLSNYIKNRVAQLKEKDPSHAAAHTIEVDNLINNAKHILKLQLANRDIQLTRANQEQPLHEIGYVDTKKSGDQSGPSHQVFNPVELGMELAANLGDKTAERDLIKYKQGRVVNEDRKVGYEYNGYDIMQTGANAAKDIDPAAAKELSDRSDNAEKRLEENNPKYFKKVWGNILGDYVYKNESNPLYGTIFTKEKLTPEEIKEYGKKAGLSQYQIDQLTPDDVPTAASIYGQAAQSFTNALTFKDENSPGGKFFTGDMPQAQKRADDWKGVLGEVASGAGMVAGFMVQSAATGGVLKGAGVLGDVAANAVRYEKAANLIPLAVFNYNNASNMADEVIGDAPEDAGKRMIYTVALGTISTALMSIDPITKLGNAAVAKSASKDLIELLKKNEIENLTRTEFKSAVQKTIEKYGEIAGGTAQHTASQAFIMGSAKAAENITNMVFDPNHRHDIMDGVGDAAISASISMFLPSLMAGVKSRKAKTPLNTEIVYGIGAKPEQYINQVAKDLSEGKITPEDAQVAHEGILSMKDAIARTPDENLDQQKLTDQQKKDYAFNLFQEQTLQKELDAVTAKSGEDKAQVDPIDSRIKELRKERDEILKEAGTEVQKPIAARKEKLNVSPAEEIEKAKKELLDKANEGVYEGRKNEEGFEFWGGYIKPEDIKLAEENPGEFVDKEIKEAEFSEDYHKKNTPEKLLLIKSIEDRLSFLRDIKERINQAPADERSVATDAKPETKTSVPKEKTEEKVEVSEKENIPLTPQEDITQKTTENEKDIRNEEGRQVSASAEEGRPSSEEAANRKKRDEQQEDRKLGVEEPPKGEQQPVVKQPPPPLQSEGVKPKREKRKLKPDMPESPKEVAQDLPFEEVKEKDENPVEATTQSLKEAGKKSKGVLAKLSEMIGLKSNWNMAGEGDALSGKTGQQGYTQRRLSEWNRAHQLGEIDPNSPIKYEVRPDKSGPSALAMDKNGVIIGEIKFSTKNGPKYGKEYSVEHVVVAPEFRGKGVAEEMYKRLRESNPNIDLVHTENRSEGFEKFAAPIAISEAYHKAKESGENPDFVKEVERILGEKLNQGTEPSTERRNEVPSEKKASATKEKPKESTPSKEQNPEKPKEKAKPKLPGKGQAIADKQIGEYNAAHGKKWSIQERILNSARKRVADYDKLPDKSYKRKERLDQYNADKALLEHIAQKPPKRSSKNQAKRGEDVTARVKKKGEVLDKAPVSIEEFVKQRLLSMDDKRPEGKFSTQSVDKDIATRKGSTERGFSKQFVHPEGVNIDKWANDIANDPRKWPEGLNLSDAQAIKEAVWDNLTGYESKEQLQAELNKTFSDREKEMADREREEYWQDRSDLDVASDQIAPDTWVPEKAVGPEFWKEVSDVQDAISLSEISDADAQVLSKYADAVMTDGKVDWKKADPFETNHYQEAYDALSPEGRKLLDMFEGGEKTQEILQEINKKNHGKQKPNSEVPGDESAGQGEDVPARAVEDKNREEIRNEPEEPAGAEERVNQTARVLAENKDLIPKINEVHAKAKGANGKVDYFHGTKDAAFSEKEKFNPTPNDETGIPGISFSQDKKEAQHYAERPREGYPEGKNEIIRVKLVGENPIEYFELIDRVRDELGYGPDEDVSDQQLKDYLEKHNSIGIDYSHTIGDEVSVLNPDRIVVQYDNSGALSRAYHYAKESGNNPELVKAVEDAVGEKQNLAPADERSVATDAKPEPEASATKESPESLVDKKTKKLNKLKEEQDDLTLEREELESKLQNAYAKSKPDAIEIDNLDREIAEKEKQISDKNKAIQQKQREVEIQQSYSKGAEKIQKAADKIRKSGEGKAFASIIPGVTPAIIADIMTVAAKAYEQFGNVHIAAVKGLEWVKENFKTEGWAKIVTENQIKQLIERDLPAKRHEPIIKDADHLQSAKDWLHDIEAGDITYEEARQEIMDQDRVQDRTKGNILNYIDWHMKDRDIHNGVTLMEPSEKNNVVRDYELEHSGELTKMLSGETIEDVTGEKPLNPQQKEALRLDLALIDSNRLVSKMKYHFGEDVTKWGGEMINQIDSLPEGETQKRVSATVGLMDALRKERTALQYELSKLPEGDARRDEINRMLNEIPKLISRAEHTYQVTQSNASATLNRGRTMRELFDGTHAVNKHADAVLPAEATKTKKKVQEAEAKTDIPDAVAKEGVLRKEKQAKEDIAKAEEVQRKSEEKKATEKTDKKSKNLVERIKKVVSDKKATAEKNKATEMRKAAELKMGGDPKGFLDKLIEKIKKSPC